VDVIWINLAILVILNRFIGQQASSPLHYTIYSLVDFVLKKERN